ncbi:MAG: ATP-binding protein [Verrucomicrobia bacterium]|nr:ATP-binding protein [Verrucomicrobiota bacterium]
MCGRYRRTTSEEELARLYHIPTASQTDLPISYKIAPSQKVLTIRFNPQTQQRSLDAIAELVENSIDAHARKITITRGREHAEHYLAIRDDGDGVPRDANGIPVFRYVATHICDSVKRRLKSQGTGV